ncbi:MAG: hypothetical protein ACYDEJ_05970 [Desulfitobacteriaceae bacterium]
MKDSIGAATVAGIIGAVLMDLLVYVLVILGIPITTPWNIAADVFLKWDEVNSNIGLLLGVIATIALSIATAILIVLLIKLTGKDFAILKGIVTANAVGFGSMGLFMPLLNIAPQIQTQPLTNLLAIAILTISGVTMSYILKKYGTFLQA